MITRTELWCVCALAVVLAAGTRAGSSQPESTQRRPVLRESVMDGAAGFLRLDSAADREAFRGWFTAIAEYQALRPAQDLPAEINDCAALLRYAYRNALHAHTGDWLIENKLEALAYLPSVKKYAYPWTPMGASLFRTRAAAADEDN